MIFVFILLYHQAAVAFVPEAVHVRTSNVLYLKASNVLQKSTEEEKQNMVNKMHPFLKYI